MPTCHAWQPAELLQLYIQYIAKKCPRRSRWSIPQALEWGATARIRFPRQVMKRFNNRVRKNKKGSKYALTVVRTKISGGVASLILTLYWASIVHHESTKAGTTKPNIVTFMVASTSLATKVSKSEGPLSILRLNIQCTYKCCIACWKVVCIIFQT